MVNLGELTMRNFIDAQREVALKRIEDMRNDEILSKSVEEWVDNLVQEYGTPEIPKINPDGITRTQDHGQVPARPAPNPSFAQDVPKVQGLIHSIHIPFTGNRNFLLSSQAAVSSRAPLARMRSYSLSVALG
jgi:hypothetical protein